MTGVTPPPFPDRSDTSVLDGWWHAISNWSVGDVLIIVVTGIMLFVMWASARYFWITRRQPVRRDAPVDGPWTEPRDVWNP